MLAFQLAIHHITEVKGGRLDSGSVQLYRNRLVLIYQRKFNHFRFCNPHFSFGNYHHLVFFFAALVSRCICIPYTVKNRWPVLVDISANQVRFATCFVSITGGGRTRLPKFRFSAEFPIDLHVIL